MTTLELYHSVLRRLTAAGILEPEAEATLLLGHLLGCRRSAIFLDGARPVTVAVTEAVDAALERRSAMEPLAYILGEQEFYGRTFAVTPEVLIPRPETELLVERAVQSLRAQEGTERPRILDLGVGSGVIAITLALEIPTALVVGLDLSAGALRVAQANAARLGAEQVSLLNSDWGSALREGCAFDLVVANPPYVAQQLQAELQPELRAEPALALYGGQDGRRDIERIMGDVARLLAPGGRLLMEIGFDQQEYVLAEMQALGRFDQVAVHPDYAGLPRILEARRTCCQSTGKGVEAARG
jgi:release factor glutamine methyltransferase